MLLPFYIPYLVHAEKQYQHKYAQLYPQAHDLTSLQTCKTTGVFYSARRPKMRLASDHPAHLKQSRATSKSGKCCKKSKKNRPAGRFFLQPKLQYSVTELTVGDVHCDFEAETQVGCCRCSPSHDHLLVVLRGFINSLYLRLSQHRSQWVDDALQAEINP